MSANTGARFTLLSRLLHWSMAVMVIAQLLIGVTMVASLSYYPLLLAIHRPLGVAILVFAVVRLVNRLTHHPPPFLATMGPLERRVATWSERLLYVLLLAQPLVGWAMLSAARFPIVVYGPLHLAGIAPLQHHPVRRAADQPLDSGAAAVLDLHRAHVRRTVSHTGVARPPHQPHGILTDQIRDCARHSCTKFRLIRDDHIARRCCGLLYPRRGRRRLDVFVCSGFLVCPFRSDGWSRVHRCCPRSPLLSNGCRRCPSAAFRRCALVRGPADSRARRHRAGG